MRGNKIEGKIYSNNCLSQIVSKSADEKLQQNISPCMQVGEQEKNTRETWKRRAIQIIIREEVRKKKTYTILSEQKFDVKSWLDTHEQRKKCERREESTPERSFEAKSGLHKQEQLETKRLLKEFRRKKPTRQIWSTTKLREEQKKKQFSSGWAIDFWSC